MDKVIDIAKGTVDAYCYSQSNMVIFFILGGFVGIVIWHLLGKLFGKVGG